MDISEQEKLVLYVIKKYNRPIGIQPLHRGIQVQMTDRKLDDLDWIEVLSDLEKKGMIERQDGFCKLTEKGIKAST